MRWNAVQTKAKRAGYLVFAMSQTETPVMTQPGPWGTAFSGFCAGLAIRWIALRYAGLDYRYDPRTLVCEMPDWQATRDQTELEASDTGKFPHNFQPRFAAYGLSINPGAVVVMNTGATGAILRQAGEAKQGCHLISLRGTAGGHAVAMQNLGRGGWRLFDANFGEFRCAGAAAFEAFAGWLLTSAGYPRLFGSIVRTVLINPPPYTAANYQDLIRTQKQLLGR
jgi:hypothetical protein